MTTRHKNKGRTRAGESGEQPPNSESLSPDTLTPLTLAPLTPLYRSWFYSIIGPAPILSPGDHEGAQKYLELIEGAIKMKKWEGEGQRVRLWGLRKKWKKRARGKDAWFETYGNKSPRAEIVEQVKRKSRKEMEEEGRAKAIAAIVKDAREAKSEDSEEEE